MVELNGKKYTHILPFVQVTVIFSSMERSASHVANLDLH